MRFTFRRDVYFSFVLRSLSVRVRVPYCDWTWGVVLDAKNLGPVQYSGRRSSLTFKVANPSECAKKCYEHSECDSFNSNSGRGQCTLFKGAEGVHITPLRDVGKHSKISGLCSRKGNLHLKNN